ncbi:MAG: class IV adenylate cyclase [Candidatus Heimdallarchaeota archaeon]|nr:class IV adenylate cyclase [Candidatus Heimdallarchaeota archaeon]MCK5184279.1 class IV adenylate cyclase [Candidatus Heimdallarchaeota archaeon]MCK5299209.1 class IV adenylate cyclase [Candidatus Heimdallarchaeota archaeon]
MIDVEIKAKCEDHARIRNILKKKGALFGGEDHQIDVYFKSPTGRLKIRKSTIESVLVYYIRDNIKGIKPSEYYLYKAPEPEKLEELLKIALGVLITVKKKREVYFIDNVKFNIDDVKGLGKFVEIEAITTNPDEIEHMDEIIRSYIKLFDIKEIDIQSHSYSDLLLEKKKGKS